MTRLRPRNRRGRPKRQHLLPREQQQLRTGDWPEADRTRWQRALRRDDPFDDLGTLVDYSPASVGKLERAYGLFLAWLDSVGEFDPAIPLEQRLIPERLGRFILNLRQRCRASTIDGHLTCLKMAIRALAPSRDWNWITRHPLAPTAQEIRAARKPIRPVDSIAILNQGRRLMDTAIEHDHTLRTAMEFRNGLLLAFQTIFTLRRGNLTEITIGQHLAQRGQRRFLQFQETVKNKADLDYEIPDWLTGYLTVYLECFRPILLGDRPDSCRLWLCDDGLPLQPGGVSAIFEHHCRSPDGIPVSTHLFRHAKATAFMLRNPANLELAAVALGHNGTSSVNQVYDRSGGIAASRVWNAIKRKRLGRVFDEDDRNADQDRDDLHIDSAES